MAKILYVDQDKDYASYMKTVLPLYGIECTSTENFALALQELSSRRFDCIVTEWTMPFPNGIELIQLLIQRTKGIPVLVVTSKVKEQILPYALEAGARSVLGKPFSAQELANTITQLTWARENPRPHTFQGQRTLDPPLPELSGTVLVP